MLIHDKPNNRGTWDPHGVHGWYIGPVMEHYQCYQTYITATDAEQITDTVAWFPHNTKIPTASNLDILAAATYDILIALQKPDTNSPLEPLSDSETQALKQAVTVLHNKLPSKSLPSQQNTPKVSCVC